MSERSSISQAWSRACQAIRRQRSGRSTCDRPAASRPTVGRARRASPTASVSTEPAVVPVDGAGDANAHDLAGVGVIGLDDVVDDLVAVATAATRSLAQLGRARSRPPDRRRSRPPRPGDEADPPRPRRQRPAVVLGDAARDAEVGAAAAGVALDDLEILDGRVVGERLAGLDRGDRVACGRRDQRLERELLGLARARPARPVDRGRRRPSWRRPRPRRRSGALTRAEPRPAPGRGRAIRSMSRPSGTERIDERRGDDRRRRRRPGAIARTWAGRLTPKPTATGTGETARTVADQPSDRRRQRRRAHRSRRRARRSRGIRRCARRSSPRRAGGVVGATR